MQDTIHALLPVALHTVLIYLFLVIAMRLSGRRQMDQLTVIDLALFLLVGSAVETAMVAGNTTLPAGLVSAGVLLVLNKTLALYALRSRRLRRWIHHRPAILVREGTYIEENLRRYGLTHADVEEALREKEHGDLDNVKYAVLEADGKINVIAQDSG